MPYIKEICRAGNTKDFNFYYTYSFDKKGGSRKKKQNKTKEAQQKVNSRQREKKLTRILNANFNGNDLYITFSYEKESRPDKDQLKKDIEKLLRDLRRLYQRNGRVLKYVWVAEVGERGATHIHMVASGLDVRKIKNCWQKGWITIKPMEENGQYRRLAGYFIKYSEKTLKTTGALQGRTYNSSKNLIIPEPEKKAVLKASAYKTDIKVPDGWYLDKDAVRIGFHEVTGYMYFNYTLIKTQGRRREEEKGIYEWTYEDPDKQDTGYIKIREIRK